MTAGERRLELAATLVLGAVGALAAVLALGFPPASRVIPTVLGIAMTLLALFQAVGIARTAVERGADAETRADDAEDPESGAGVRLLTSQNARRRTLLIVLATAVTIAAIPLVGYPLSIGLFLLGSMLFIARLPVWASALIGGAGFAAVLALFELLLGLQPFTGALFAMF